ncbi:MAG: putative glycosyltransferase [Herminiimonas sp.]|nr:putative glycosyltransferase [Herminiimonas sp.]
MQRISIVVPTKDRPDDLAKLLASLAAQTRKPDQIIIVDGSDPVIRPVVDRFAELLALDYVRVFPPSLAKQRNAGMAELRPDITLAGYIDDDIVLEPAAVERMLAFWESASADIGGAAFNITNNLRPSWQVIKRIFELDHPEPGLVLRSGFPSSISYQETTIDTDWLYGGATVWRREVIERFPYDEWFIGTGFGEDVDFSFNVREHFRLVLVSDAKLAHYSHPIRSDRQFLLGKWQVINRMYLVRKYRLRGLSLLHAWHASVGLFFLYCVRAVLLRDKPSWDRARGIVAGMYAEMCHQREQIGGFVK